MYVFLPFLCNICRSKALFVLFLHISHSMQMQLTRTIAFDLMRKGRIEILQRGKPIDIGDVVGDTIKGPIRLRIIKRATKSHSTQGQSSKKRMRCNG
jgi:hypothetical protein